MTRIIFVSTLVLFLLVSTSSAACPKKKKHRKASPAFCYEVYPGMFRCVAEPIEYRLFKNV